jgi:hypothetical protein
VTSIREQLEAKQRRRLVQPIQITDPSADQQAWMGITSALQIAMGKSGEDRNEALIGQLEKQLEDAHARWRSHYADVELQSMPREEWEAAQAKWQGDKGIDWAKALAPLLELSCVDESLQDADWWESRLNDAAWSEGDTDSLRAAILILNVDGVDPRVPKG